MNKLGFLACKDPSWFMAEILYIIFSDFFFIISRGRWFMSSGKMIRWKQGMLHLLSNAWCFMYQQLWNKLFPLQNKAWQRIQLNRSLLCLQPVSPKSSPTNIYTQFQQIYLHPDYFHISHKQSDSQVPKDKALAPQFSLKVFVQTTSGQHTTGIANLRDSLQHQHSSLKLSTMTGR